MNALLPPYRKAARVIRAARKMLRLSQAKAAKELGISQAKFSRFESGTMVPSALEWLEFCELTSISPQSILHGNFDQGELKTIQLRSGVWEGGFVLPERYSRNRGSRPLSLSPILKFSEKILGEKSAEELYKSMGIDPDFFACQQNQISVQFAFDVISSHLTAGSLCPKTLRTFFDPLFKPETHGRCWSFFRELSSRKELVKQRLQVTGMYEANFTARIEHEKKNSIDVSIQYRDHVLECDIQKESQNFFNKIYFKEYLRNFGNASFSEKPNVETLSHGSSKNDRLIYRIIFQ